MSDTLLKNVLKGAGFIFVGILFSKVLNYLFRVLLAQYLGPGDFGLFSLAMAIVGVFVTFALLGFPDGIVRFVSMYKGETDKKKLNGIIYSSLKVTGVLSVLLAVVLFLLSDFLSVQVFSKPELAPLLRILSMSIPIAVIFGNFEKVVLAFQKVQYSVFARSIVDNVLKVGLTFLFLYLGFGLLSVVWVYVISLFLAVVLLVYLFQTRVYSLGKVVSNKISMVRPLASFSFPLLLNSVFAYLLIWIDTLVIGIYLASEQIGIYNVAVPTALLVYVVPTTLRTMFYPVLSEAYSKGHFAHFFKRVSDWILFLTLPIAAFLIIFADVFLGAFFGEQFVVGSSVVVIITLAYLMYALVNTSNVMLYVKKKTTVVLVTTVASLVLNIFLNFLLIPKMGIVGAAIATASSLAFRSLLILIESYKVTRLVPFSLRSVLPFVAIIVPVGLALLFKASVVGIVSLIVASLLFEVVYLAVLLLLRFFTKEDFDLFETFERKLPFRMHFVYWFKRFAR
jgi:O-antigen/teichoic acid export membrane protein